MMFNPPVNANFTWKVTGFQELYKELQEFPKRMEKKALRQACFAGAQIAREQAKGDVWNAPTSYWAEIKEAAGEHAGLNVRRGGKKGYILQQFESGWVAKNIFVGIKKFKKKYTEEVRVFLGDKAWFGVFLEYGMGKPNKAAHPFLRPALEKRKDDIVNAMWESLNSWIQFEYAKKEAKQKLIATKARKPNL